MTEAAAGSLSPAAPAGAPNGAAPPTSTPWYHGIDGEIIGHIQNRGVTLDDPKVVVENLAKAHREATAKLGVPPDQLIRVLRPESTEADRKSFWQKLGAPADPKEYDFAAIKHADGTEIDQTFLDAMRAAFAAANLPKDAAAAVTRAYVKFTDDQNTAEQTNITTQRQVDSTELQKEWGKDFEGNLFIAKRGAEALGLKKEQIDALESVAGWGSIMRAFHKVGRSNGEPRGLITGIDTGGPMTREQAMARMNDLKADTEWVKRFQSGNVDAKQEFDNLTRTIAGYWGPA